MTTQGKARRGALIFLCLLFGVALTGLVVNAAKNEPAAPGLLGTPDYSFGLRSIGDVIQDSQAVVVATVGDVQPITLSGEVAAANGAEPSLASTTLSQVSLEVESVLVALDDQAPKDLLPIEGEQMVALAGEAEIWLEKGSKRVFFLQFAAAEDGLTQPSWYFDTQRVWLPDQAGTGYFPILQEHRLSIVSGAQKGDLSLASVEPGEDINPEIAPVVSLPSLEELIAKELATRKVDVAGFKQWSWEDAYAQLPHDEGQQTDTGPTNTRTG